MATRFYLPDLGTPSISPAFDAGWEQTGEANRITLVRKNLLSVLDALADRTTTVPITTTQDILSRQFVSEPLRPQTITGTFSLVVRCNESLAAANATLSVVVKLCSSDGSILGGTLFSVFSADTAFPLAASAATRIVNAQTVTTQTASAGDRLLIEIGCHAASPTLSGSAVHRFGNNAASDFALTSALTTDLNPWCEFSQDLFAAMPNNFQSLKGSGASFGETIK